MMKLTRTAIEEIKAVIEKPFDGGELRQIESMGNLFVSPHRFPEDVEGIVVCDNKSMDFWFQYSLKIDGVSYYLYGGIPSEK